MADIVDVKYVEKVFIFCWQDIVSAEVFVVEGGQVVAMSVHTVEGLEFNAKKCGLHFVEAIVITDDIVIVFAVGTVVA